MKVLWKCNNDFIAIPWICYCMSGGFCVFCVFFNILIRSRANPWITETALTDQTASHTSSFRHVAENDAEQRHSSREKNLIDLMLIIDYYLQKNMLMDCFLIWSSSYLKHCSDSEFTLSGFRIKADPFTPVSVVSSHTDLCVTCTYTLLLYWCVRATLANTASWFQIINVWKTILH